MIHFSSGSRAKDRPNRLEKKLDEGRKEEGEEVRKDVREDRRKQESDFLSFLCQFYLKSKNCTMNI